MGVFAYSHEENTHAYGLKDDVPNETKQSRLNGIMEAQMSISEKYNFSKIGTTLKCIVDREESNGSYVCRTEKDSPDVDNEVHLNCQNIHLKKGSFV